MENNEESLQVISDSLQKAYARCNQFNKILVSISGGADSDVMLDLLLKVCPKEKLTFVFFDTGIEYQATKDHLTYLENKYDIVIDRQRASKPVPLGCKEYGLPFISKFISQMIERLQKHEFDFVNDGNKTFEELDEKYPNMKGALTWWCNKYPAIKGKSSYFNISATKYLKEFMIANPPTFKISDKCCKGAKKNTSKEYEKHKNFDLKCMGLRYAEGGVRSTTYKSCFEYKPLEKIQKFRPIWWLKDKDKEVYDNLYDVKHSKCYSEYGMKRTGCAGCPFNSKFEEDLEIVEKYEPKLYKACNNIFGPSYEYTRCYRQFKREQRDNNKHNKSQLSIFDL